MDQEIRMIAMRIAGLRDACDFSIEEMAETIGITPEEYIEYENGQKDFTFSQLFRLAHKFSVDITDILTGDTPKLHGVSFIRSGEGVSFERSREYHYQHLAFDFKDKLAEPFLVVKEYDGKEDPEIFDRHHGQEFDYLLEGCLKVVIAGVEYVMYPGDSIYYDSSKPHGMKAIGGQTAKFIAVVIYGSEVKE